MPLPLMQTVSRRHFCRQALGLTIGLTPAAALQLRADTKPAHPRALRLGGPMFTHTEDPDELALAHRQLGYRAAYCPNLSLNDSTRIAAFARAFQKHDVVIAEVGRWVNLLD